VLGIGILVAGLRFKLPLKIPGFLVFCTLDLCWNYTICSSRPVLPSLHNCETTSYIEYLSITYLSMFLSMYLPSLSLSLYLSIYLSIYLSLPIYLSNLSLHTHSFYYLFLWMSVTNKPTNAPFNEHSCTLQSRDFELKDVKFTVEVNKYFHWCLSFLFLRNSKLLGICDKTV
jgi:hypothetical protein